MWALDTYKHEKFGVYCRSVWRAKVHFPHSVKKVCIQLHGRCFLISISRYECSCAFLTVCSQSRPGFCCYCIQQTRQLTATSLGADAWHFYCHACQVQFHASQHLTHLFGHFQQKKKGQKKSLVCGPPTQTHAHDDVCQRMWLKQNNSFDSSHGWFCVHNCSALPS